MIGFTRKRSFDDFLKTSNLSKNLSEEHIERLRNIKRCWNFFKGYHWEELPRIDTSEVTTNYCKAFVNKFVAFELGKSFTFSMPTDIENLVVDEEGRTLFKYLEDVWVDNKQYKFTTECGYMKSITGEAWVQIKYERKDEVNSVLDAYPKGRIRLMLLPTQVVFPVYDPKDRENLISVTIMYEYTRAVASPILGRIRDRTVLFKQEWTKETVTLEDAGETTVYPNTYGFIPFVCIKNVVDAGETDGVSDLEDIIPLNAEFNLKTSNISEIIDYHSAPVTIVYGAKVGNLEKGANKMWGGLSKDARIENLELKGDLGASSAYLDRLKTSMCEIAGIPEQVLGGATAISNTSGVALQYMNLPLIEKVRVKKTYSETALEEINTQIIIISLLENLIKKPDSVALRKFVFNEVTLPETLPKDTLLELQQISMEVELGIESRENAAKRMGKENTEELFAKIKKEKEELGEIDTSNSPQINSGFLNGEIPQTNVRGRPL
jgi:hypothetical protein